MAVDTRDRRAAAIHIGSPWRGLLPLPDGAVDTADRPLLAYLYSGIAAAEPEEPEEPLPEATGEPVRGIMGASFTLSGGMTRLMIFARAALPADYEVMTSASWMTMVMVSNKTTTGFTFDFSVPVPPGGGEVSYTVLVPVA